MFDYDVERFRALILKITRSNVDQEAWAWLSEKLKSNEAQVVNTTFAMMPRKAGKSIITISKDLLNKIDHIKPGFTLENWTADSLGRLCLLISLDTSDKEKYIKTIENLFLAAEVSELVALYSSLPLLAWPESWKLRCAEGIRSNIGTVLEAIMYHNPYPSQYLDENAWNQLILKAFFTDKDIIRIPGIEIRANAELANTLGDYAHERWAAQRKINPYLWFFTTNFLTKPLLDDLKRVLSEGDLREKQAAALTLAHSDSEPALKLLEGFPDLLKDIQNEKISWVKLAPEEEKTIN